MAYVQGTDRRQSGLFCLEDFIGPDAPVRVIDAFCGQVDFAALDFRGKYTQDNCRPIYHPSLLLRLYIYGYLNAVRSSRKLEAECSRWRGGDVAVRQPGAEVPHHCGLSKTTRRTDT
jgi:transposase